MAHGVVAWLWECGSRTNKVRPQIKNTTDNISVTCQADSSLPSGKVRKSAVTQTIWGQLDERGLRNKRSRNAQVKQTWRNLKSLKDNSEQSQVQVTLTNCSNSITLVIETCLSSQPLRGNEGYSVTVYLPESPPSQAQCSCQKLRKINTRRCCLLTDRPYKSAGPQYLV